MRKKLKLHQLQRLGLEEFKASTKKPIIVVLDNIRSALNVGSIFRTADAFAIEKIVLTGITARPPHKEINKTAIGATDSVAWVYHNDIEQVIRDLKNQDYTIVAVEQTDDSTSIQELKNNEMGKCAIVFGNEVLGVSDAVIQAADIAVEIPQFGTKHSLNVAVCAGITLWEIQQKVALPIEK